MSRVFLVDDHEIVRRGVADLLATSVDPQLPGVREFDVVGEASGVRDALVRIPVTKPDVVILDVRLPDGSGVELCRELRAMIPDLKCLMLTSYSDDEALMDAIMAGASGFVLKQIVGSELTAAVRVVARGGSLLDPNATKALMDKLRSRETQQIPGLSDLTEQQRAIFELIGEGMTNREIGERLFLAEKTVKNHVTRIHAKLGIHRRAQAAVLATKLKGHVR